MDVPQGEKGLVGSTGGCTGPTNNKNYRSKRQLKKDRKLFAGCRK